MVCSRIGLLGTNHRITLYSQRSRCVLTSATLLAASQVLPPPVGTRRQKYGMSAGKPDNGLYGLPRPHRRSVVAVKAIDGDGSSWQALK